MQRNIIIPSSHPGYVSGRYYQNTPVASASTSTSTCLAINSITYSPFRIDKNIKIDRFAVSVGGNVTLGAARFGIYNTLNGLPSTLLLDTDEIIASSAGVKEAIISLALSPDWYWYAGATAVPPSLFSVAAFVGNNYFLGQTIPSSTTPIASIRHTGFTYGTMPSIAPVSNLSSITGNTSPLFWFRVV